MLFESAELAERALHRRAVEAAIWGMNRRPSSMPNSRRPSTYFFLILILILSYFSAALQAADSDPLPSWNEGENKSRILDFVKSTTTAGSADFVPTDERIATFDNDGTLWVEQPMYTQVFFSFDRIKALAPQHPEWKNEQPFKAVLEGDMKSLATNGEAGLIKVLAASHTGMTTDEFSKIVSDWMATARHPRFKRPFNQCVYQPMLELLAYLRANGFKTYIVSGGGIEFMRPWTEKTYGIPPEQVVGSAGKAKFELRNGQPTLLRLPEILFIDDKVGKPEGINLFIGRRPIAAFGNSDGDQQMLEWTAAGSGKRLALIVHHTDAEREYAYDRKSPVGQLNTALDEAKSKGWIIVDMKRDWKVIFPLQEGPVQ